MSIIDCVMLCCMAYIESTCITIMLKEVTKNHLGVFGLSFTIMSDICLYTHIYVVVPRVTVSL